MKNAIRNDVENFYDSRDTYEKLKVPWKRGIIYYGPPGNGKTISVKAIMNTLYSRDDAVPTLYVRTLSSFGGPEYSISEIFALARRTAPCLLVFEDLDSIVTDNVRSYFLNAIDGIQKSKCLILTQPIELRPRHVSIAVIDVLSRRWHLDDRLNQPLGPARSRNCQTTFPLRSQVPIPES